EGRGARGRRALRAKGQPPFARAGPRAIGLTAPRPAWIFRPVDRKGSPMQESKGEGHGPPPLPDHVAQDFAPPALDDPPDRAYDVIVNLTPEEIALLERVGAALTECESNFKTFALH